MGIKAQSVVIIAPICYLIPPTPPPTCGEIKLQQQVLCVSLTFLQGIKLASIFRLVVTQWEHRMGDFV